nr:unnamed protein product [Digitaria exilis]
MPKLRAAGVRCAAVGLVQLLQPPEWREPGGGEEPALAAPPSPSSSSRGGECSRPGGSAVPSAPSSSTGEEAPGFPGEDGPGGVAKKGALTHAPREAKELSSLGVAEDRPPSCGPPNVSVWACSSCWAGYASPCGNVDWPTGRACSSGWAGGASTHAGGGGEEASNSVGHAVGRA